MKRTQGRPLPTNRLTNSEALWFAGIVANYWPLHAINMDELAHSWSGCTINDTL